MIMARRSGQIYNDKERKQLGEPYQIYTEVVNTGKNVQGKGEPRPPSDCRKYHGLDRGSGYKK